ncbi:phosphatidylinositol-3,5-bisphosphate 5-phosphatase [Tieghemiomyces parasiticus]|uniref:Phosphatidylinositol-3,5-bisphosphate 5-phosphatase n=1 Tax=Tieghemiomyces parasiticus TaxID=78921 RepID=A0A9W7ZM82_9FUNG|nr:phosphatidylinositol-3,5-bisphosphate 5-phosphatase [Tieghemiomyces parasiticus]
MPLQDEDAIEATRPCRLVLNKVTLYETRTRYYIVGSNPSDTRFRVLKIDRTTTQSLQLVEDDVVYSKAEITDLLAMVDQGNRATGGMQQVVTAYGIVGFIRFTGSYYICLITQRSAVAVLGGHYIYHIDGTMLLNITAQDHGVRSPLENRYLNLFHSVDLTKNFYFSYTYDLTHTLQYNMTHRPTVPPGSPGGNWDQGQPPPAPRFVYNDMFVWNRYLLKTGFQSLRSNSDWILPVIYGFVHQANVHVFGRDVYLTLIARRSRFFAGARFLKRGVNDEGYVANEVETEQIVHEMTTTSFHRPGQLFGNPAYTSFVQHRGSIPLFWSQDTSNLTPKPPIELNTVDPYFSAAALHFDHLFGRYGAPIIILNLIKRREVVKRESKLGTEFHQAVNYLNQFLPVDNRLLYIAWDMSRADKNPHESVFDVLEEIGEQAIQRTQFFHSGAEPADNVWRRRRRRRRSIHHPDAETDDLLGTLQAHRRPFRLQTGILRSNCIDCLDRTNTAQNLIGKCALGHQLYALGVIHQPFVAFDTDAVRLLNDMYRQMGNTIALQYGGSQLVNTIESYQKINHWTSQSRDMIETFRRFYSNSFVDSEKQDAINLFLGNFISRTGQPTLWELSTDYYLHHKDPRYKRPTRSYRRWWSEEALVSPYELAEPVPRPMTLHPLALHHHVDGEDEHLLMSYWNEYYRPRLYTSFAKLFAFNIHTVPRRITSSGEDVSPFASNDETWQGGNHEPADPKTAEASPAPPLSLLYQPMDGPDESPTLTGSQYLSPRSNEEDGDVKETGWLDQFRRADGSSQPSTAAVGHTLSSHPPTDPWRGRDKVRLLCKPSVSPAEEQEYRR